MGSANGVGSGRRVGSSVRSAPQPSGMARAIRGALALTTVALAMSGSGTAFAGVCTPAGLPAPGTTVDCEAPFAVPITYAVEDLTVIIGATDNTTNVTTSGAVAVQLTGTTGDETLLNYTPITATDAYAVIVTSTNGDISVTTYGNVSANSAGGYPDMVAIYADSTDGVVNVDVMGGALVQAINSGGAASAIEAYSQTGNVGVDNAGDLYVSATGNAYGVYATGDTGTVTVDSSGTVTVNGDSEATGIYAHGHGDLSADNSGTINASTTASGFGDAYGVHLYTSDYTSNNASVDNSGSISAFNTGNGDAYGIYVYTYYTGNATVINDGQIVASAVNGEAIGIYLNLTDGNASVSGTGSITVTADNYAEGVYVHLGGYGDASVTTSGAIDVTSTGSYAYGVLLYTNDTGDLYVGTSGSIDVTAYEAAFGIHAYSTQDGNVDVVNSAVTTVLAYYSSAYGIYAATNGAVSVDNSGDISATTYFGSAYGIYASGDVSALVNNDANITVVATNIATGIYATSYGGDVTVTGGGSVSATGDNSATGIYAQADVGAIGITLSGGSVYAGTTGNDATGIYATTVYGGGGISIDSDADITANANTGTGTGIYATTALYGGISITGSGNVTATSVTGDTYGIYAYSDDGDVYVNVSGDITAYGADNAYGIHVETYGDIDITSNGAIDATALNSYANATGIFVYTCDGCDTIVDVDNNGDITATAGDNGYARGIYVYTYGQFATTVRNDGSITATTTGTGDATGIYVHAAEGPTTVGGTGTFTVSADHYAYGIHVQVDDDGDLNVVTSGAIYVTSSGSYGYGIAVSSNGYGYIYVGSAGDMDVDAYEYAVGIHAATNYDGPVDVVNGGDMTITSSYASAVGVFTSTIGGDSSVYNDGTISVTTYFGSGQGINVNTYNAVVGNDGSIIVDAAGGYGIGIQVTATGTIDVDSQGSIDVTATGVANGIYIFGDDGDVTVTTGGTIDATSTTTYAYGIEVSVFGDGNVYVTNGADITVGSAGAGYANGIDIHSYYGDITLGSTGDIGATSVNGDTHGIYVDSSQGGSISITSAGAITANGGGYSYGIEAIVTGAGTLTIDSTSDLLVDSTTFAATGILAQSYDGNATVDSSGDVTVTAETGAVGIAAYTYGAGSVDVGSAGDVSATTNSGNATGIEATSYSADVTVDLAGGSILASSVSGDAFGIDADAQYGAVTVTATGTITTNGYDISGGIATVAYGDTSITGSLDIYATSTGDTAQAYGIYARHNYGTGDIYINLSGGSITANSTGLYASADGINAIAYGGDATVINVASIDATGYYTGGIDVITSTGDAYMNNSGDITLNGAYNASGVIVNGATALAINSGNVTAIGGYEAWGIRADAFTGDTRIDNSGDFIVTAGQYATGLMATSGGGDMYIYNSASVAVTATTGYAWGLIAFPFYGGDTVLIDNSGDVSATGYLGAYGVLAYSTQDVTVDNSGSVTATSAAGLAEGIVAYTIVAAGNVYVNSDGDVTVDGATGAVGIKTFATYGGSIYIDSAGAIDVYTYSGDATGISANSYQGIVDIDVTAGSIDAVSAFGNAAGVNADAYGDVAISVYADVLANAQYGQATGIDAYSYNGNASVTSVGSMTVYSSATAYGIHASTGLGGDIYVSTAGGPITVDSSTGAAFGIHADATGAGLITIYGDAGIDVYSYAGAATGIFAHAVDGDIIVGGTGDIGVDAASGGTGIDAFVAGVGYIDISSYGDITVDTAAGVAVGILAIVNGTGPVTVQAYGDIDVAGAANVAGIRGQAQGDLLVVTGGDIDALSSGYAFGIQGSTGGLDSDLAITTLAGAAISVTADGLAVGIQGSTTGYDGDIAILVGDDLGLVSNNTNAIGIWTDALGAYADTTIDIGGDMAIDAQGSAQGVNAVNGPNSGDISVYDTGDMVVSAYDFYANGIFAQNNSLYGGVHVDVSGSLTVASVNGPAHAIHAVAQYGDIYVTNTGTLDVSGFDALAIQVQTSGNVQVYNDGSLYVQADRYGSGIDSVAGGDLLVDNTGYIQVDVQTVGPVNGIVGVGIGASATGDVVLQNSGGISVEVSGVGLFGADAVGIQATSGFGGDVSVSNSGDIDVVLDGTGGYGADASGIIAVAFNGLAIVSNDASIQVYAQYGQAVGILSRAGNGDIVISNDGDIAATAGVGSYYDSGAFGVLAYSNYGSLSLTSSGSIAASTVGDYYADATGVDLAGYDVYFSASGDVVATASADPGAGAAYATGVRIDGDYVSVYTGASVSADADGFYATAIGLEVNGSYGLYLGLDGDSQAVASGDFTWATGVQASSYVDILAYSTGDISATSDGTGYAYALGVGISSLAGDIFFYNGGNIIATAADYAVAVHLDGSGNTVFINNGTVVAYADSYGGIAFLSADADDTIYNNGSITGAIVTGDGDDTLYVADGATWNAFGVSDFGNGDDTITNYGSINMSDAVIDLGLPGALGNAFCNYGVITVSGAYNVIDMEGGSAALAMTAALLAAPAAVPSSNPQAFYNYGLIDFQDGAPDDVLNIVGDFGGDGSIAVDVSGLNNAGDLLYIDGSIVSGNVNSLDIDLLDLPADGFAEVPVVEVSGDSVAGSFVLGSVSYSPIPFVTTNISLVSNINSANTQPDMFSLRVAMGASDAGRIGAVLPAGVQLLMKDVVGSWHKRVEGLGDPGDGKFSLWARLYVNKGKVDPDSDGTVDGDFSFEQKNSGGEAGFDFAPNGRFNFGLILGRANASQDLRLGLGTDRIEGNVAGGYGTFRLPRGFYFDLSHRRMKFDARIDTPDGAMDASGEAESSNAESGYSFNFRGFEIEGQLQVTKTKLLSLDSLGLEGFGTGPVTPGGATLLAAQATAPEPVEFDNDADLSQVSRAGVDIRKKFKTQPGTLWELHATMNRVRESGGSNRFQLTDTLGGKTDISGDSSLVDLGFTARRGLLLFYGSLTWQDGGVLQDFFGAQFGAKYTW